jgi:hypothetical protein
VIWRIGSVVGIDVWSDNWILRKGLKRPLGLRPNKHVSLVNKLLLSDGQGWNADKLNELFFEGDVEDILKIPVGRAGIENYIAWNYTKNGIFTVKSAYHLKMKLKEQAAGRTGPSNGCDGHRGWLALWGAEVLGKARIHVWRMIQNGLVVGAELQRRRVKDGVRCIACNREESTLLRFWKCPHSVAVWDEIQRQAGMNFSSPDLLANRHCHLRGWMLDWLGKLSDKEISVGIMVLYQMWLARNEAREESRILDPASIARRSLALVEEWLASATRPQQSNTPQVEHWLPPEEGWVKANVDGSFSASSGSGGCGVILRDRHGVHLSSESHFLLAAVDPERAELVACRRAVLLADWLGFSKLCLESNCLGVVAKIKSPEVDRSLHGPLVEEIKGLLRGFDASEVRHMRRSSNFVAHSLAKESCGNKSSTVWVESPPDFIVSALARDLAG